MDRGDQMTVQQPDGVVRPGSVGVSGRPVTPVPPRSIVAGAGSTTQALSPSIALAISQEVGYGR